MESMMVFDELQRRMMMMVALVVDGSLLWKLEFSSTIRSYSYSFSVSLRMTSTGNCLPSPNNYKFFSVISAYLMLVTGMVSLPGVERQLARAIPSTLIMDCSLGMSSTRLFLGTLPSIHANISEQRMPSERKVLISLVSIGGTKKRRWGMLLWRQAYCVSMQVTCVISQWRAGGSDSICIRSAKMAIMIAAAHSMIIVQRLPFCYASFFFQTRSTSFISSGLCSSTNSWKLEALPFIFKCYYSHQS